MITQTAEAIRATIATIERDMRLAVPLSDAEIASQASAGADLDELLAKAESSARKQRVLQVRLQHLADDLCRAEQVEARPAIEQANTKRSEAVVLARAALCRAQQAADDFAQALSAFDSAAQGAADAAYSANSAARGVGLPEPHKLPELSHTTAFHELEQQLQVALKPYRRAGSQLGKYDLANARNDGGAA